MVPTSLIGELTSRWVGYHAGAVDENYRLCGPNWWVLEQLRVQHIRDEKRRQLIDLKRTA